MKRNLVEQMSNEERKKYHLAQKRRDVKSFEREYEHKLFIEELNEDLKEKNKYLNSI